MSGRPDLFPPDRGLQVRMALALAINGLLVAAVLALAAWGAIFVPNGWSLVLVAASFAMIGAAAAARKGGRGRGVGPDDTDRIRSSVDRISALADMQPPAAHVESDHVPLSWTHTTLRRRPRVYVTTGLLDLVSAEELDAVVAHEIAHIRNHDAFVMSLLAAPSAWVLRGFRRMWGKRREDWRNVCAIVCFGWYCAPIAALLAPMMYVVSRHRELAADRGAAILTGSPARVASVLARLSDGIVSLPARDLRLAEGNDAFHLLPARKTEPRGVRRLWATHPRLETRLAELERLEHELQHARGT